MSSAGPEGGTVVIGVGSPLMGDDGLGLRALAALERTAGFRPAADFLDGGTWGMNLLPFIEAAERVLVLDAIDAARPPGTLIRLADGEFPRFLSTKVSPHQIDLREVLALAELRGTLPTILALGLQPAVIEMRTELSPILEARLPDLVGAAIECLEGWGHERVAPPLASDRASGVGWIRRSGAPEAGAEVAPCTR